MVTLSITSNNPCKLGSFILALENDGSVLITEKIDDAKYVGKYQYDGFDYQVDINVDNYNNEEPLCVGDELKCKEISWEKKK